MSSRSAGAWLAQTLNGLGVDHVFFIDAILRHTLVEMEHVGIKRVLVHSEKAAAYMADGYGRMKGIPGVCLAQSVGAANLAAGLQDAYLAQSPVLAITGRKPLSYRHRNAYQEIAHQPLFSAVTKYMADVNEGAELPRVVRQAWRAALEAAPGPVHIDVDGLSGDRMEKGQVGSDIGLGATIGSVPLHRPSATERELDAAVARLRASERLVIVAGTGAALSGAGEEVIALAERLNAPIAASLGAYSLFPTRHKLFVGTVGNYSAPPANEIVSRADVVLYVGCRTGDQVTLDWQVPPVSTPVIHVDIEPLELGRNYPDTVGVLGDPRDSLRRLLALLPKTGRDDTFARWSGELVASWREGMAEKFALDTAPIRVERLCAEISKALPDDGIVVADTGYSAIWTCTCMEFNGTGQTYLRAAGSLGRAFPASMGAKCAAGARAVVCFTGDGAFYYHLAELETARRCNIPVVVVVNNNSGFGQSIANIRAVQGETPGNPGDLWMFRPTNFAEIAEQFGVRGIRVERAADLAAALRTAIEANEPVVLDVVTDIEPRAPAPWKPA